MSGQLSPASRIRLRRGIFLGAALVLLIALSLGAVHLSHWLSRPPGEPFSPEPAEETDPRLTYDGPFHNIHPDVHYVGDASCAGCHADIARSYSHHPMGRSLIPALA